MANINIAQALLDDLSHCIQYRNPDLLPGMPVAVIYTDEFGRRHDVSALYNSGTFMSCHTYYNSDSAYITTGTFVNNRTNKMVCYYCGEEKNTIRCPACGGSKTV